MFFQQFAIGGFEQLLSLFTLNCLGMNASSNAGLFAYSSIFIVLIQGYFIGKWSRKLRNKWLVKMGLIAPGIGLLYSAITPKEPVTWYSQTDVMAELTSGIDKPGETLPVQEIQIELPSDEQKGWLGLGWILVVMIPAAID